MIDSFMQNPSNHPAGEGEFPTIADDRTAALVSGIRSLGKPAIPCGKPVATRINDG